MIMLLIFFSQNNDNDNFRFNYVSIITKNEISVLVVFVDKFVSGCKNVFNVLH